MDHRPLGSSGHGIFQARILEWVFPSPGDLPDPGIEPGSPTLQADSLPSEPPGKPLTWVWVSEVAQSCPTLCDPMDCSLTSSSVHEIFQARVLEWVAISFSRRSSQPKDWICISCIGKQIFYKWATWEAQWSILLMGIIIDDIKWKLFRWIIYHLSHWGSPTGIITK